MGVPPSKSLVGGVVGGSSHSRDKPLVDLCDCYLFQSVGSSCRELLTRQTRRVDDTLVAVDPRCLPRAKRGG